jgi:hypothetical protein
MKELSVGTMSYEAVKESIKCWEQSADKSSEWALKDNLLGERCENDARWKGLVAGKLREACDEWTQT